jgi:hypothetical protein
VSGTPMTYRAANGTQFIVAATGAGDNAALAAFALPASSGRLEPARGGSR